MLAKPIFSFALAMPMVRTMIAIIPFWWAKIGIAIVALMRAARGGDDKQPINLIVSAGTARATDIERASSYKRIWEK